MSIKVACQCGKRFVAPPQLAGKSAKCPSCGSIIAIAAPAAPLTPRAPQANPAPAGPEPLTATDPFADSLGALPEPASGNDLWSDLPQQPAWPPPQQQPQWNPQQAWPQQQYSQPQYQQPYRQPTLEASKSALASQYMANAYQQEAQKSTDTDTWGTGQIFSGILTMAIAVIWFVTGLFFDIIFFFPPIMFIGGLVAVINGIAAKVNR